MIISAVNSIAVAADTKALTTVERAEGKLAFSALLYEYGANLSAGVLVVMWIISVIVPRVLEWLDKRKAERKQQNLPDAVRAEQAKLLNPTPTPAVAS